MKTPYRSMFLLEFVILLTVPTPMVLWPEKKDLHFTKQLSQATNNINQKKPRANETTPCLDETI